MKSYLLFQDELTPTSVKHGFQNQSTITDEYQSAHNSAWNKEKIGAFFNAVVNQHKENNQIPDQGKRKQQVNSRDNYWLVRLPLKP